jgi:NAD(P)-dependent dehydrogenase (short-subunit alcohol dehydrogenase family)
MRGQPPRYYGKSRACNAGAENALQRGGDGYTAAATACAGLRVEARLEALLYSRIVILARMNDRLKGQVAIVTGGGRGFGRAIAVRLAAEGAAVAVVSRSMPQLAEVAAAIERMGGHALPIAADVTDKAAVERACRMTEQALGPVTFLVNNAGVPGPFGPIGEFDPEEWWEAQRVHQLAPLLFATAVIAGMKNRGSGRILNINATAAVVIASNMSAYCVGKAAQLRFTQILDAESTPRGVRAFALQPGMAVTALAEQTARRADARKWVPAMVERITKLRDTADGTKDLERCAKICARIAAGEYDSLSGRYLDIKDDFEKLLRDAAAETIR